MHSSNQFKMKANGEIVISNEKVALPGPPLDEDEHEQPEDPIDRNIIKSQGMKQAGRTYHDNNKRGDDGSETRMNLKLSSQNVTSSKRRIRTSAQKMYRSHQSGSHQVIHVYKAQNEDDGINTVPLTTHDAQDPKINDAMRERTRSSRRSIYSR